MAKNLFSIKSLAVVMVQCTSGNHYVSCLATAEGTLLPVTSPSFIRDISFSVQMTVAGFPRMKWYMIALQWSASNIEFCSEGLSAISFPAIYSETSLKLPLRQLPKS